MSRWPDGWIPTDNAIVEDRFTYEVKTRSGDVVLSLGSDVDVKDATHVRRCKTVPFSLFDGSPLHESN